MEMEDNFMKYIVYLTTNLINKKIYIGVHKTEDPDKFDGYIGCGVNINIPSSYMKPTTPFQYAVKKYGVNNFLRKTLKVFELEKDAYDLEKEIVTSDFILRKDTYNACKGGICCGQGRDLYQFDLNGVFIKKWKHITDASDFYNISDTAVVNSIFRNGSAAGYYWSFEEKLNINERSNLHLPKCYKYNKDGKFIDEYSCMAEAAKLNNINLTEVQRSVKAEYLVKGFYYSLKLTDEFKPSFNIKINKNLILYIYDLNGNYITTKKYKELKEYFNIKDLSSVRTAIRSKRQYKDFQFSLEYKEKLDAFVDKRNIKKSVIKYDLYGNFIKEYKSTTEAIKENGTGVNKVLKGQQKIHKNYIYKYKS